jgi:hypothetical protein
VLSRQLLVKRRVVIDGWPTATVAEQLGVSRATAYKSGRRFRVDGLRGLEDRNSRPHHSPRCWSAAVTARLSPLTGHPCSTIYGVLRRAGLDRGYEPADRLRAGPSTQDRDAPLGEHLQQTGCARPNRGHRVGVPTRGFVYSRGPGRLWRGVTMSTIGKRMQDYNT